MPNEMGEASGNVSVEFRLSLKDTGGDTDLLDSFSFNLTPRLTQLTLGELIDTVFPDDAAAFDDGKGYVELRHSGERAGAHGPGRGSRKGLLA